MNRIKERKTSKKIIIMIIIVMLFNFVMPCVVNSFSLLGFFSKIVFDISDGVWSGIQLITNGDDIITTGSVTLSPGTIFAGKIPLFDANIIKNNNNDGIENEATTEHESDSSEQVLKEDVELNLTDDLMDFDFKLDDTMFHNKLTQMLEDNKEIYLEPFEYYNENTDMLESLYNVDEETGSYTRIVWGFSETRNWRYKDNYYTLKYSISKDDAAGTIYKGTLTITKTVKTNNISKSSSIASKLRIMVSTWYNALTEISLVGLLVTLVYIAIRMIISSASSEKAKYKKMLFGWFQAVCLLFTLHFIISMSFTLVQSITDVLATKIVTPEGEDSLATGIRDTIKENIYNTDKRETVFFETIVYCTIFIYTISFSIQYLKRVIYLAFLILISPLIALTYPLDKLKDGKAQAFEVWLKEFTFNLLIQPVHLLLYNLLIVNATELVEQNVVYALVAIASLLPAEKFVRKMFGLESSESSGAMASALGGAAIMNSINSLGSKHPAGGHSGGGGGASRGGSAPKGNSGKIRTANQGSDPYAALREGNNNQSAGGGTNTPIGAPAPVTGGASTPGGASAGGENNSGSTGGGLPATAHLAPQNISQPPKPAGQPKRFKRIKGGWNVAKKYAPRVGGKLGRGAIKIAGAATLGTIGLAAGLTTGDMSKAVAGLTGGVMAGNRLGGSLVDGVVNVGRNVKSGLGNIADTYREGKYGKEEAANMKEEKEYKKTGEYKKLVKNNPGSEEAIDEFVKGGITDIKKIEKALKKPYDAKQAIAYMRMAEKCSNKILYDKKLFQEYLTSYGISASKAEEIRKEVASFK